jgi:hypothetical protein
VRFRGSLQPLSRASLRPTGVRHEVPVSAATAAGEVEFLVTNMVVPPTATGIGTMLAYTATFRAAITDADHLCGTLPSGMITNPTQASIAGLPWAAVRIPTAGPMPPLVTSCP